MKLEKNFTQIPNEILRCPYISIKARLLYSVLLTYKPSHPSYKKLQDITGLTRNRVGSCLKELLQRNIINYEKGNSRKKANLYTFNEISQCNLTSMNSDTRLEGQLVSESILVTSMNSDQKMPSTSIRIDTPKRSSFKKHQLKKEEKIEEGDGPLSGHAGEDENRRVSGKEASQFLGDILKGLDLGEKPTNESFE